MSFWTVYDSYKHIHQGCTKHHPTSLNSWSKSNLNTILHIAETPVPLSDSEFLNAFTP